jgi:hypothetical protein
MNSSMSEFLKRHYKKSKGDLYSSFIERCTELMASNGRLGMITQQSFMFISSFEDLRNLLLSTSCIEAMAHVGPRAFAEVTGEKVNTTAFVLRREAFEETRRAARGVYFRLVKEPDAESKRVAFEQALARYRSGEPDSRVYVYRQGDFAAIPGSPWVYWITPGLLAIFKLNKNIGDLTDTYCGMTTSDNQRFLRFWWEVGLSALARNCSSASQALKSGKKWFPYMKGGSFQRWYGNQQYVVN